MKKSFANAGVGIVICFFTSTSYGDNEIFIGNTGLKQITIYQSGASVTREGSTSVDAGSSRIVFEELSAYINPQSIAVKGTGDFIILGVSHQMNYLKGERIHPEIKSLEDSLETLQFLMGKLQNRKSVLNEEQSLLLSNKSVGGANTGVSSEQLAKIAEYMRLRLTKIKDDLLDAGVAEKKLKENLDKVQQQLNSMNAKRNQPSGNILVNISAKSKMNIKLEISYHVHNVSWSPVYDIRAADASSPVQLSYKASVTQQTGEDWNNAKIRLSTGNPSAGGVLPELFPWYLNFYQPVVLQNQILRRNAEMSQAPAKYEQEIAMDAKSMAGEISVLQNQLSTEYEIRIPYSILSDGKPYMVDIQNYALNAQFVYSAVPKLDGDAFLLARITGWQDFGLLPGIANVFFEGSYVNESYFNPVTAEDTLSFSFGRDKRIVVKREKLKEFSANQFIGGNRVKTFSFEITVRNPKSESIKMILHDHVPVSQDKDIEVKLIESSAAEYNNETGKLTWNLQIAAGETIKKRLTFSVKYPKDKTVGGI